MSAAPPLVPFGIAPLPGAEPPRPAAQGTGVTLRGQAVAPTRPGGRSDGHGSNPTAPEPLPPREDPPRVKGLGVPPLHTLQVGDFDRAARDPFARLFAVIGDKPAPKLDRRL